jgi:hypothetical protein
LTGANADPASIEIKQWSEGKQLPQSGRPHQGKPCLSIVSGESGIEAIHISVVQQDVEEISPIHRLSSRERNPRLLGE